MRCLKCRCLNFEIGSKDGIRCENCNTPYGKQKCSSCGKINNEGVFCDCEIERINRFSIIDSDNNWN